MKFAIKTPAAAFAKKALKTLSMTAMIAGAVSLAACSDSDDDDDSGLGGSNGSNAIRTVEVKASDIYGLPTNASIAEVRATAIYVSSSPAIAKAVWDNGFKLQLPETVSSSYLEPFFDEEDMEDMGNIKITGNAKVCLVDLEAYDASGEIIEDISLGKLSNTDDVEGGYIYSSGDMKIQGSAVEESENSKYTYSYNVDLKKGWNRIYHIDKSNGDGSETSETTTTAPSGITWMWGYSYKYNNSAN